MWDTTIDLFIVEVKKKTRDIGDIMARVMSDEQRREEIQFLAWGVGRES